MPPDARAVPRDAPLAGVSVGCRRGDGTTLGSLGGLAAFLAIGCPLCNMHWEPPKAGFDLVAIAYLHLPPVERRAVHIAAARAVAPRGRLVVGHDRTNLTEGVVGPPDPDRLFTAAEVARELIDADEGYRSSAPRSCDACHSRSAARSMRSSSSAGSMPRPVEWGDRRAAPGVGRISPSRDGLRADERDQPWLSQTAMSPADGIRPALTTLPSMTSPGVRRMP